MKKTKLYAWLALAAGMALPGAATLGAQTPYNNNGPEFRYRYNNGGSDRREIERLRREIAEDRLRLERNRRAGRWLAVAQNRRELARDERALDLLLRRMNRDYRGGFNGYR